MEDVASEETRTTSYQNYKKKLPEKIESVLIDSMKSTEITDEISIIQNNYNEKKDSISEETKIEVCKQQDDDRFVVDSNK